LGTFYLIDEAIKQGALAKYDRLKAIKEDPVLMPPGQGQYYTLRSGRSMHLLLKPHRRQRRGSTR
jgi:hypothetical protein